MSETELAGEDRAAAVVSRLRGEQSLLKGFVGALLCGLLGLALAHLMASMELHTRTTFATAFIGALVAFGMRQWGRGVDRIFQFVAILLTAALMVASMVLAGCKQRAATSRFTFEEMLASLNPDFALTLLGEAMGPQGVFLFLIGLAVAWLFSGRRLRPQDLR